MSLVKAYMHSTQQEMYELDGGVGLLTTVAGMATLVNGNARDL